MDEVRLPVFFPPPFLLPTEPPTRAPSLGHQASMNHRFEIVAELNAEAAQMDSVRALLPRFEAKIQRVLDRVWGNDVVLASKEEECQSPAPA